MMVRVIKYMGLNNNDSMAETFYRINKLSLTSVIKENLLE